jgi:hypothetical protein
MNVTRTNRACWEEAVKHFTTPSCFGDLATDFAENDGPH